MTNTNITEILDFAIGREQEAHDFYMDLAGKMDRKTMKEVFEGFAQEELGHKSRLESIKSGKASFMHKKEINDLKIADYVVDIDPNVVIDYQQALIVAMKREKAAFKLYTDLAESIDNDDLKVIFLGLAQEEAKHKLRFEVEYDDNYNQEN